MYEYYVRKVENVVDGDTIDVLIDLGFDILFASRVRLADEKKKLHVFWRFLCEGRSSYDQRNHGGDQKFTGHGFTLSFVC